MMLDCRYRWRRRASMPRRSDLLNEVQLEHCWLWRIVSMQLYPRLYALRISWALGDWLVKGPYDRRGLAARQHPPSVGCTEV
jgi:hypothetical protein